MQGKQRNITAQYSVGELCRYWFHNTQQTFFGIFQSTGQVQFLNGKINRYLNAGFGKTS